MDMARLMEALTQQAGARSDTMGRIAMGTVQSYNPAAHTARVIFQPDGVLSGWLPVATMNAGNGWSIQSGLAPGTQVVVAPHEGDPDSGVILGALHSTLALPPKVASAPSPSSHPPTTNVAATETLMVHPSGSVFRMCDDGSVFIKATVNIQGDLHVLGDVFDKHGSLDRLRGNYNTHAHMGVQAGTAESGLTTEIDPEGDGSGGFA